MWARIDDQFYLNPKNAEIDRDEQDLFLAGIVYCNLRLTDGFIPMNMLPMLMIWAKIPLEANEAKHEAIASRLVEHCFWEKTERGYWVHDFLDWNISKADAEELREARSEAGRLGGMRSGESRRSKRSKIEANAEAKAKQNGTPNPNQYPYLTTTTSAQSSLETYKDAGVSDYANRIHPISDIYLTAKIENALEILYEKHVPDWWSQAIEECVDADNRNWRYLNGILNRCLKTSTPPGAPKPQAVRSNGHKPEPTKREHNRPATAEDMAEYDGPSSITPTR